MGGACSPRVSAQSQEELKTKVNHESSQQCLYDQTSQRDPASVAQVSSMVGSTPVCCNTWLLGKVKIICMTPLGQGDESAARGTILDPDLRASSLDCFESVFFHCSKV